ncbi:MAG TPA: YraN family protein [Clostridiales bacterium]|nr:YraN family protein [Clostridiales bacterium]
MINKEIGNFGEMAVCKYLEKYGYTVLKRNYRIRGGEIDIIAYNSEIIAFVEVKTRKKGSMVSGFEAVNDRKKGLIIKTASDFCCKNPTELQPRFDVAEVIVVNNRIEKINYISNAFDATGYDIFF